VSRLFQKTPKFNIGKIKDEEKRQKYITEITDKFNEIKENWNIIKKTILEAAYSSLK